MRFAPVFLIGVTLLNSLSGIIHGVIKRSQGGGQVALSDKNLTCVECGYEFTFTVGEQEFFTSRGFTGEPRRCPQCRAARRNRQRESGEYGGAAREMHPAVCAQCGIETRVPFRLRDYLTEYELCESSFAISIGFQELEQPV